MKRTILTFGLISGAICSVLMDLATVFGDKIGFGHSMVLGYTIIVLSFLLVFFGIRSYRQEVGNGYISFGRAFGLGISITLITCVCYVVTWEIIYYFFMPDFMDKYGAYVLEKARAAGASAAALQAKAEEMRRAKEMYANPLINSAMTFIEPFPVGLLITLISAVVLRKKEKTALAVGD
jgi:small-conductance mechanosensitive channel